MGAEPAPSWRKAESCHANGTCVEVAAWRTAKASGTSECVEVARFSEVVGVRDSKRPGGAILKVSPDAWLRFVSGLKEAR
jgi:hypothetical protein